jgi:hypothetical protein
MSRFAVRAVVAAVIGFDANKKAEFETAKKPPKRATERIIDSDGGV